jgi:hypothetical protein
MADVVGSGKLPASQVAGTLQELCPYLNNYAPDSIFSPLTITLGDEFQGVVDSKKAGTELIIKSERWLLVHQASFRLRYVLWYGPIDMPINTQIAYGMLGQGLTTAREMLLKMKKQKKNRFYIGNEQPDEVLNRLFFLHHSITAKWKRRDYELAGTLLQTGDYKETAMLLEKDISLVWRRKNWLGIEQLSTVEWLILHESKKEKPS